MAAEYTPNDTILKAMIEYLQGWLEDNPGLRASIVDAVEYNIAYVEVLWFGINNSDTHERILQDLPETKSIDFKECFKVLQSAFDNNVFN